ncbi:hypothetical protein EW026_g4862 [Hermanssonia centrifuga]|uniref:Uncharacterized protein n=1 Tax=Hermanssonia centrifuga TaxID=98765 RepID=A0A4S4KHM4_9APHY|nr:hypothetical protein EW026_g4862 [Hermanssonia centrifuga]
MVNTSPRKHSTLDSGVDSTTSPPKKTRSSISTVVPETEETSDSLTVGSDDVDDAHPTVIGVGDTEEELSAVTPEINEDTRPHFDTEIVARLNGMNNYSNPATSCYSLHTLDIDRVTWGDVGHGRLDNSEYLCIDGRCLMLWTVAEVICPNFIKNKMPVRKSGLLFRPILDEDYQKGVVLTTTLCHPDKDHNGEGFWASRWIGSKNVVDENLFDRSYEALTSYKSKGNMPKYPITDLKPGDVVLLETPVIRWAIRDGDSQSRYAVKGTNYQQNDMPEEGVEF